MDTRTARPPLSGIVPPLATPLLAPDKLDIDGLERLVAHVLAGGVQGIFVLGTTGEGPSLSEETCALVVRHVCGQVGGSIPVLVSVTDPSADRVRRQAEMAHSAGARALVLAPPYYFGASQEELLGYLERLVPCLPLPVFLYNIPSCTKLAYSPELLRQAARLPNLAGLKDSSGDMGYFAAARVALPPSEGFSVLCGPEELLAVSMRLKGDGGVCGGANLFPKLFVRLYEAALLEGPEVSELHRLVMELSTRVYAVAGGSSGYLRGLKAALEALRLCDSILAEPFQPLAGRERELVRDAVVDLERRVAVLR